MEHATLTSCAHGYEQLPYAQLSLTLIVFVHCPLCAQFISRIINKETDALAVPFVLVPPVFVEDLLKQSIAEPGVTLLGRVGFLKDQEAPEQYQNALLDMNKAKKR